MDLGIFDLDGLIINNLYRERGAVAAANSIFMPQPGVNPRKKYAETWNKVFYSSEALFNAQWFPFDTLMGGAEEALLLLRERLDMILFVTSRPEYTRTPTVVSMEALGVFRLTRTDNSHLYMKPGPYAFTKTVIWKSGTVQDILARHQPDRAIFADDTEVVRQEVQKENPTVYIAKDLQEALTLLSI